MLRLDEGELRVATHLATASTSNSYEPAAGSPPLPFVSAMREPTSGSKSSSHAAARSPTALLLCDKRAIRPQLPAN
jgi:hypothetical protein